MMNRKVIAISGKARHGKDTVADLLIKFYAEQGIKAIKIPLATYIKTYAKMLGWDGRDETKPRELLQQLGTDIIKIKMNKRLFHVERVATDIEILSEVSEDIRPQVFIIPDTRFQSEVNYLKAYFKDELTLIRVERSNFDNHLTEEQKNHLSEVDLDNYGGFNYKLENDGAIESLAQKIREGIMS